MPRIRTIKPEFFTSPDVSHVSHAARLLYIAMWCWADDYGRGEMNLLQLRAFAFPETDKWLNEELQRQGEELPNISDYFLNLVKEVINGFKITVYNAHGRTFYQIETWDAHQKTQRKAASKFPAPDDEYSQLDSRFHDSGGTSEEMQGTSETGKRKLSARNRGKGTGEREEGNTPPPENTDPAHSANAPGEHNPLEQLAAAYATTHTPPSQGGTPDQWSTPQDPRCWKHRAIPRDRVPACRACADARTWFKTRDTENKATRREAINNCTQCDDNGIHYANGTATRCTHQPQTKGPF